jgi:hypothetical protein
VPEPHSLLVSLRKSISDKLGEWIVGVVAVALIAIGARYGDALFDAAQNAFGKRGLLIVASLLLLASIYSVAFALRSRHRKTAIERLRPVKGKGYGIDPITGEAACPRCSTETRLVFMSDQGHAFYCYVCSEGVLK